MLRRKPNPAFRREKQSFPTRSGPPRWQHRAGRLVAPGPLPVVFDHFFINLPAFYGQLAGRGAGH